MAKITINVPDELVERIETAYAGVFGYQEKVSDGEKEIDNPQTKIDFVKEKIIEKLRGIVTRWESDQARATKEAEIASDLSGIE